MKISFLVVTSLLICSVALSGCLEPNSGNSEVLLVDDDGVAEYSTIQQALLDAQEGDSIQVAPGTYYGSIYLNKSVRLLGENTTSTFIEGFSGKTSGSPTLVYIVADNCTFQGFTLRDDEDISGLIGLNVNSSDNTIAENVFASFNKGVSLDGTGSGNSVKDNMFSGNYYGIYSREMYASSIAGNTFTGNTYVGVYLSISDRTMVTGNLFEFNDLGLRIKSTEECTVYHNIFKSNDQGLLCCCGAANNVIFENNFYDNAEWNARDDIYNQWDDGSRGNYWDDYPEKYPDATSVNGIWDTPYQILGPYKQNEEDLSVDRYPLVDPVKL